MPAECICSLSKTANIYDEYSKISQRGRTATIDSATLISAAGYKNTIDAHSWHKECGQSLAGWRKEESRSTAQARRPKHTENCLDKLNFDFGKLTFPHQRKLTSTDCVYQVCPALLMDIYLDWGSLYSLRRSNLQLFSRWDAGASGSCAPKMSI